MNIIQVTEYSAEIHTNYRKYAAVRPRTTKYGKNINTVHWIFYCDGDPKEAFAGSPDTIIDITDTPEVEVGWVLMPDNITLANLDSVYRQLLTDKDLMGYLRYKRTLLLKECDPFIIRHLTQSEAFKSITEEQYVQLTSYMQQLRDLPETVDLNSIVFPNKPSFLP